MDCKEVRFLRISPREPRLWSEICSQLLTSQQADFSKVRYKLKLREMAFKEMSPFIASVRKFKPSSEIFVLLWVSQQTLRKKSHWLRKGQIDGL